MPPKPKKSTSPTSTTNLPIVPIISPDINDPAAPPVPQPDELTLKQLKQIYGDSGTQRYSGFFLEEPNSQMRDDNRVTLIEEMRRTDGSVKAALNAIKTPILATDWRIEGEDPKIVEFVEEQLFHMKHRTWKDFLREACAFFDFGHYVFEIIWDVDKDNNIILCDLAPRIPRSIFRWKMSNGEPGIRQIIRTDDFHKSFAEIPMQKLLVLTNDKEGDDITGQSILRAAYKHYKFKDTLYRIQGIAAERHGVGIPVIKMPAGFGAADKAKAEEFARNTRANEQGYLVLPSKDWEFDIVSPKGNSHGDAMEKAIQHHNSMILMTIMATFLGLGTDGTGSYALSKDLSSFFLKHVEDKCTYIAEQIREQVIRKLVAFNFGEDADVPELKFSPLGDINYVELSTVLTQLASAGLIQNDGALIQFIHKQFKLPELTDEDVTSIDDENEAQEVADKQAAQIDPKAPAQKGGQGQNIPPQAKAQEKNGPAGSGGKSKDSNDNAQLEEKKKYQHGEYLQELGFKPWRKLTMQESRSNFRKLNDKFNTLQTNFENKMDDISRRAIDQTTKDTKGKLDAKDYALIGALGLSVVDEVRATIKAVIADAHNFGAGLAAEELRSTIADAARPALTAEGIKLRDLEAEDLTTGFVSRLESSARTTAINAINADASTPAIIATVRDNMKADAERMIQNISGTAIGQAINRGRLDVFNHYIDQITKFERSEVLDDQTCAMCMSLDGRIVTADDPVANMDLVHTNCRGVWIPIMIDDPQPELNPIPKSVMDNFDLVDGRPVVNAFTNLKKAIPSGHVD